VAAIVALAVVLAVVLWRGRRKEADPPLVAPSEEYRGEAPPPVLDEETPRELP
jgi:hypothetical protein